MFWLGKLKQSSVYTRNDGNIVPYQPGLSPMPSIMGMHVVYTLSNFITERNISIHVIGHVIFNCSICIKDISSASLCLA